MLKRIWTGIGALLLASVVTFRACSDDVARQLPTHADEAVRAVGHLPSSASEIAPLGNEAAAAAPAIPPGVVQRVMSTFRPYARSALREAQELLKDDGVQDAAGLAMDTMCTSLRNVRLTGAATRADVSRLVLTMRLGDEALALEADFDDDVVADAVDKVANATSPREMAVASMQEFGCPLNDIYGALRQ